MKEILELITDEMKKAFVKAGYDDKFALVSLSNRPDLCEYQCNGAMPAAKVYHKAPLEIARDVVKALEDSNVFASVEAVKPGFINLKIQEAGACAVVLEGIPAKLADIITKKLFIPTIGIGAGNGCDGQVLVYQDMLGLTTGHTPKFVKRFAEVGALMRQGITDYISETKEGSFPADEHTYAVDDDVINELMKECD